MKRSELSFIFRAHFFWFLFLILVIIFAVKFIPLQPTFLGGGSVNYLQNPLFWAWANFDGKHYVSIAGFGYGFEQYSFFPLYPSIIYTLGKLFGGTLQAFVGSGILVSQAAFFAALLGLYKLLRLDFSEKFTKTAIILMLIFPTSFYFAAVYTESLFLMLMVWSLYFARRRWWLMSAFLGILLTATRFVGLVILPVIIAEWFIQNKELKKHQGFPEIILAIPTGLLAYMYYLERKTHNMITFYSNLALYGEQRSASLITLPQVFYRYLVKILPSLETTFFPIIFTTYLEFFTGLGFLILIIYAINKLRFSYWLLMALGYLIPTFSGSFSSLPRYVLVLFPAFIVLAQIVEKSRFRTFAFGAISFILLVISFALFALGYWVS
jgi:hypothetical protein